MLFFTHYLGMKFLKDLIISVLGVLSALYLLNIYAGVIEVLPDNIPLLGNLDEVAATALLLNCLAYFGLDLRRFFKNRKKTVDV